jgi:hypothetical protein
MSMSHCILLDHAHIGDQQPFLCRFIRLVLYDHKHITFHTTRSWPHWRTTHPFLRRFDLSSTTWSWERHVAYFSVMPTMEINTSLPSSIRSPSTTWSWARHIAYYSIMATLNINTALPSSIRSPRTTWSWARHIAYSSIMPTLEINTLT